MQKVVPKYSYIYCRLAAYHSPPAVHTVISWMSEVIPTHRCEHQFDLIYIMPSYLPLLTP